MRRGRLDESDALHITAIVAALLVNEIRFYQEDATFPEWIGVVTLFFHSFAYFSMLATITIDAMLILLWTIKERSMERVIIPPSFFLLAGLFSYFVQLGFGVVIDIFGLRAPVHEANRSALYAAYAVPQFIFYFGLLSYGWILLMTWSNKSKIQQERQVPPTLIRIRRPSQQSHQIVTSGRTKNPRSDST